MGNETMTLDLLRRRTGVDTRDVGYSRKIRRSVAAFALAVTLAPLAAQAQPTTGRFEFPSLFDTPEDRTGSSEQTRQAAYAPATQTARSGSVLSASDEDTYRQIFRAQERGSWSEADRLLSRLQDRSLMGYVLSQRYLHPATRASYEELRDWLTQYRDLPQAESIRKLAEQRVKGVKGNKGRALSLPTPTWDGLTGSGGAGDVHAESSGLEGSYSSSGDKARAAKLWQRFHQEIRSGSTYNALRLVQAASPGQDMARLDLDRMRSYLAYVLFIEGNDGQALELARQAVNSSGDGVGQGLWAGGLALWRQGNLDEARQWFERLAQAPRTSPWLTAAGAYWAARAALRDHRPDQMGSYLRLAADHPRTFYGLLARRALGLSSRIQWEASALSTSETAALQRANEGRRALALAQVGKTAEAEQELRGLYRSASGDQRDAILRMADLSGMSGLALYLSAIRSRSAGGEAVADAVAGAIANARYPVPTWSPQDGWRLDRALIFAFVRQESAFDPSAQSGAGARGLMQVMPATADLIARKTGSDLGRKDLMSPERNLALGQRYLEHLLTSGDVEGNLFYAAAAYNAGPGNLKKWKDVLATRSGNPQAANDPLLFIESIPMRETRAYVEQVMANMWLYYDRLGQHAPSLDSVAAGDWPRYVPQDNVGMAAAPSGSAVTR
ncbi:lytic transglycosylase domain-containing protein [Insolitispirillum peregrinum]|uniref:Soluble lytic murein transglycosylase n=1 Tax=Insolitispirillum peregrinum TaxID=80876 RepID=A0A1N7PRK7_9PROT|nr:lytic transglycosylase domain-containing protein [Insolitispirillum peregrinum]SIT13192.1 Soluble lytic murein transglycosylase [Insolitispirillum peregrinum]